MTPIKQGTAARLKLRKPLPVLEYVVSPEMEAFNKSMRGLHAFAAENNRKVSAAFAALSENLARHRL